MSDDTERIINVKELNPDIIPPVSEKFMDADYNGGSKIVVVGKPGCFAPGTEIMMYDGTIKKVEDVKQNDVVMGDDSTPRNVLDLCHDFETMYKIKMNKGKDFIVNEKIFSSFLYSKYSVIGSFEEISIHFISVPPF